MMNRVVRTLTMLVALGLLLSLLVHGSTLARVPNPIGAGFFVVFAACILVWFPTILLARKWLTEVDEDRSALILLRGSPVWLRCLAGLSFVYALVNFWLTKRSGTAADAFSTIRMLSGHTILFYSVSLLVLVSYLRAHQTVRCINGHPLSSPTEHCAQCGQPAETR
jgi:hypothetical protein